MLEFTIRVSKDGDSWCALVGEDLQSGVAAFGPTPPSAVRNLLEVLVQRREGISNGGAAAPWEKVIESLRPDFASSLRIDVQDDVHGPYCKKYARMTDPNNVTRSVRVHCGLLKDHEGECSFVRSIS